ncbi:MAG: dTDP-4-dehydrorhamnose 3,5-epimerase [Magnetococcales bacterium]|nr:dTDP-4-dehydrorhamnose 3,5-epimerase [Magnetococcales bacterium]
MKFLPTALPGVLIVEPQRFTDTRGVFMETYHLEKFRAAGLVDPFVQDNHSRSLPNVLRGLHYQEPFAQGKLVRVIRGRIYDVAVDIRRHSPHFGRWIGVELSEENQRQLWIPPGFAHGFCVLADGAAEVIYKCTAPYHPEADRGIRWNDPAIGIDWPISAPLLSPKDAAWPTLADAVCLPT